MDVDRETMKQKSRFDLVRLEYLGMLTDLNSRRRFELLTFFGKFIQVMISFVFECRSNSDLAPLIWGWFVCWERAWFLSRRSQPRNTSRSALNASLAGPSVVLP